MPFSSRNIRKMYANQINKLIMKNKHFYCRNFEDYD